MGSLILIRHSITAASASGRNLGASDDPPLAPEGAVAAERLAKVIAEELAELPHEALRLVSSPARRCRETMAPIAGRLSDGEASVEIAPGLREIDYGAWDGLTAEECLERDPELRRAWIEDPYDTRCPAGESGRMVAERAFPVFDELEAWLAQDRARVAVVVAHNHVNRLRLTALLAWPMRDYRRRIVQDPAGYSIIGFDGGTPGVRRINAPGALIVEVD